MKNLNQPFETLEPLTEYLDSLVTATESPTTATVDRHEMADTVLGNRAMLYRNEFEALRHNEVIPGFTSGLASGEFMASARLALCEPDSEEYYATHAQYVIVPSNASDGRLFWGPVPRENVSLGMGSIESRRQVAQGSVVKLAGHLAVSGAFEHKHIRPAYAAMRQTLGRLGVENEADTRFFIRLAGKDLMKQYHDAVFKSMGAFPISNHAARRNITAAWRGIGKPLGPFTRAVSLFKAE